MTTAQDRFLDTVTLKRDGHVLVMTLNRAAVGGIFPFGGATIRLPQEAGWGNAMRWLLTGEEFDASAHLARADGDAAAIEALRPEVTRLFGTADETEGVRSFVERRPAEFQGR